jgi:glycerol kinase
MAFQVRDVMDAMTSSQSSRTKLEVLRVDGGASVMDLLLQLMADQVQVPVARPASTETTAFGAAALAGLAEGVWGSLGELSELWRLQSVFEPRSSGSSADIKHESWLRAVARSRDWA